MEIRSTKFIRHFVLSILILWVVPCAAQLTVTEVGVLPEPVSNNAVCEGFVDGVPYVYSFAGIDNSKAFDGIHLRSFRYNTETGISEQIADLPDNLGKIAAGASRIGDIIYIVGGYNVFSDGTETSVRKVHRYDINANAYLPDAANLRVPTDDHMQGVWRDSLLYVVTGWSNVANTPRVQIYNPSNDEWVLGTSLPDNNVWKSFGTSGVIKGDTILFFGGATSGFGFGIQNTLRTGIINPDDPTDIDWSISTPDPTVNGYRMASAIVKGQPHWIGGSNNTYNYNGLAYDNSGGVSPNNRVLVLVDGSWISSEVETLPMDLRGIAMINDSIGYLAGGMLDNQQVTDKIYKLEWTGTLTKVESEPLTEVEVYPNPFTDHLQIKGPDKNNIANLELWNSAGQLIKEIDNSNIQNKIVIQTNPWPKGTYILRFRIGRKWISQQIVKR